MKKVIITLKGSLMNTNTWKEGQEITCHENLAIDFINRGIATDPDGVIVSEEEPIKKPKKK